MKPVGVFSEKINYHNPTITIYIKNLYSTSHRERRLTLQFIFFSSLLLAYTQSSLKTASVLRAWSCYVFAWFHCCTKHVFLYIFVLRILAAGKELQVSFYLLLQAYNFFQLHLFLVLVINSEITFSVTKPQFLIL